VPTFFCESKWIISPLTTKTECQHIAQQWCNMKVDPTHLHYDCMSFTEYNSYPTICLDFAQYVVHVMSTGAQSDISLGFYTHIAHIFLIPFVEWILRQ